MIRLWQAGQAALDSIAQVQTGGQPGVGGPPGGISAQRAAELYAAVASDGGQAQVALRLVQYETALEHERKRTAQALSACKSSEHRAREAEAIARNLHERFRLVSAQRGQLAASLDASLRQLGKTYTDQHKNTERPRPTGPFQVQPGSWGLLQDLHQLHLKLHDVKAPILGSPPRAL